MDLRWPGNKEKETKHILPFIPSFSLYIEPFCGSAAVFRALQPYSAVLSDVNIDLIHYYKMLKENRAATMYERLRNVPSSKSSYNFLRSKQPKDDIERACIFYYLRRTCFNGYVRYNKSGGFNVPFGDKKEFRAESLIERDWTKLFRNVRLECASAFQVLEMHASNPRAFIFIDPPYLTNMQSYYIENFDVEHHERLNSIICNGKAKCMVLVPETPLMSEIYCDLTKVHKYRVSYNVGKGEHHMILVNYDI